MPFEDTDGDGVNETERAKGMSVDMPANGVIIRNLGMACNYLMSHILHFYHLVALDYVDVNGTGLIPKGFLAPNYDSNYYARGIDPVLQTGGAGAPVYSVNAYDYGTASYKSSGGANGAPLGIPGIDWDAATLNPARGDLTAYFAGQYVRALKFRRQAQQLGALFTGKMPQASSYTAGGVTIKPYDPALDGADKPVVAKVHELLYAGPGVQSDCSNLVFSGGVYQRSDINNPLNGQPLTMANPHPESLMGFVGKPADFWTWAGGGYLASDLPAWAAAGVPGAGSTWAGFTGTYMFDAVAAAHVFPEYFWFGAGYGRHLAWGIFEGGDTMGFADQRLITRKRAHVTPVPNGTPTAYNMQFFDAAHLDAREFTPYSAYSDSKGDTIGRHMWANKQKAVPLDPDNGVPAGTKAAPLSDADPYTYAKAPRYFWAASDGGPDDYVPYEVGPLSRLMANASALGANPSILGPNALTNVLAVNSGSISLYYPGILADVDATLAPLGSKIGVFPTFGTNLTSHLAWAQTAIPGSPVFYLPPNAISLAAVTNGFGTDYYGSATLDRIACRALETYYVGAQMLNWFNSIDPALDNGISSKTLTYGWGSGWKQKVPKRAKGAGLTEAPRGALGHWVQIGKKKSHAKFKAYKGKVSNYAIITPTTWNINPKDHNGANGPAEFCILGTPLVNEAEPIEVLRVIHSFDFCCACTVHVMNAKKEKVAEVTLEALP